MGSARVHAQVFDASVCLYCFLQYTPKKEYYKEEKHEEVRLLTVLVSKPWQQELLNLGCQKQLPVPAAVPIYTLVVGLGYPPPPPPNPYQSIDGYCYL